MKLDIKTKLSIGILAAIVTMSATAAVIGSRAADADRQKKAQAIATEAEARARKSGTRTPGEEPQK